MTDDKQKVKDNLKKILVYYGAIPTNNNWQCIPGRHKTPNYDLSVKENICCCHCGLQGDSLNIIAAIENYNLKNDFKKIISKGLEIIGSNYSPSDKGKYESNKKQSSEQFSKEKQFAFYLSLTKIINEKYKKSNNYNYFYERGIYKKELFDKYKFIVENPVNVFPKQLIPIKLYNIWAYEYICPVWENGKVVNCLLRRNDKLSTKNKKILNLSNLELKFLNADYLKQKQKSLFLTEGFFDALSYENEGFKAISLNSVVMVNRFIKLVKLNINNLLDTIFFIAFDKDLYGNIWTKKLIDGLKELNLKTFNLSIKGNYKDVNEYYVKDKKAFKTSLNWLKNNIINK